MESPFNHGYITPNPPGYSCILPQNQGPGSVTRNTDLYNTKTHIPGHDPYSSKILDDSYDSEYQYRSFDSHTNFKGPQSSGSKYQSVNDGCMQSGSSTSPVNESTEVEEDNLFDNEGASLKKPWLHPRAAWYDDDCKRLHKKFEKEARRFKNACRHPNLNKDIIPKQRKTATDIQAQLLQLYRDKKSKYIAALPEGVSLAQRQRIVDKEKGYKRRKGKKKSKNKK